MRNAAGQAADDPDGQADTAYARLYPYHAELAALSELKKKPGFGARVRSGMGGHSLLYLNGVRVNRAEPHPALRLCAPGEEPAGHGVGISVNAHYKNANWVAAEGRDFLWRGALAPGEPLRRDGYERTQAHAKAIGTLDGVQFHEHLFRARPPGMSAHDYMYEISIATDYAARFGRDTYRARIPLDRARMARIVDFLNALNAGYRDGTKVFRWRLFNNNCAHVAHNALAAAGIWAPWPTGQLAARAMFRFPVPKNELVDLMLRANDLPVGDPRAIYADESARRALEETASLPTAPGALAVAGPAIRDNEIYDTARLRLIFFDNPFWGPYRPRFNRLFTEPRYVDLAANLDHFKTIYAAAMQRDDAGFASSSEDAARFTSRHQQYIAREAAGLVRQLTGLGNAAPARRAVAV